MNKFQDTTILVPSRKVKGIGKGGRGGLKCMVKYHKIDFYIPNQQSISIVLRSDG